MGLEDVKKDIISEAEDEKEDILEQAREEKQEIIEEAEGEAERIRDEVREEIEEEKKSLEKKTVSNANMEAKKEKLEAKEKALDRVFQGFEDELTDLSQDEREEMIKTAVEACDFDVGLVRGSESFKDLTDIDFEASDLEGFVLVSEDGERQMNFSFSKIVEDFRGDYRQEVAERLFG